MMGEETVLVIDDDVNTLDALSRVLTSRGYDVATTSEPEQGLRLAAMKRPAVVLTDLFMPQVTGFEVGTTIRGFGRVTQVIIMTGQVKPINVLDAYEAGASDYVNKPFIAYDELLLAVERACHRYHRWCDLVVGSALSQQYSGSQQVSLSDLYSKEELSERRSNFLRKMLRTMDSALSPELLKTMGHKLSGAGGNLGMTEFVDTGRRLESLGHFEIVTEESRALTEHVRGLLLSRLAQLEGNQPHS